MQTLNYVFFKIKFPFNHIDSIYWHFRVKHRLNFTEIINKLDKVKHLLKEYINMNIFAYCLNFIILKSISKKSRFFILASRDNWVSCNQTLGCLRLYGDSQVSRAQPRINANEILLQHDWLLVFFFWGGGGGIMFWNKRFFTLLI